MSARTGVWLIAGTATSDPYPCRCHESRDGWACANGRCPCYGRTDLAGLTPACCGVRAFLDATMRQCASQ